jgi:hypothetical protein
VTVIRNQGIYRILMGKYFEKHPLEDYGRITLRHILWTVKIASRWMYSGNIIIEKLWYQ